MKKISILLILLTLSLNGLYAQQKSTGRAMLYSAVIPGAGQLYLGNNNRAGAYMGAELLLVLSYLRLNKEVEWKTNSYKLYAYRYADVPMNSDDGYYRFISNYISSDDYNANEEMYFRNRFIVYQYQPDNYHYYLDLYLITGDDVWEWDSRDNWLHYRGLRRDKQQMEILANFALGASLLNRLVSVIDTALIARSIRRSGSAYNETIQQTSFLSNISIEPDYWRNGLTLKYEHTFK